MRSLKLLDAYTTLAYPATQSAGTGAITVTQTTGAVTGTTHLLVLGDTIVFDSLNANSQTNAVPPAPLVPGVEYWVIPDATSPTTNSRWRQAMRTQLQASTSWSRARR